MVRNIVQLWVRLRCLCDHLWHQRMLPDCLTWQQRWQHFGIFHLIRCYNYNCLSCWIASPGVNDRQKGHTDEYTGESVLGTCFLFNLGKPSAIEVIFPNVFENCNGISVQTFGHWGHDWWWWNVANVFLCLRIAMAKLFRCAKMGMMPGSSSLLRFFFSFLIFFVGVF